MAEASPNVFQDMQETFFSFDAYTKLWLGLSQELPRDVDGDARAIRRFLMTPGNPSCV